MTHTFLLHRPTTRLLAGSLVVLLVLFAQNVRPHLSLRTAQPTDPSTAYTQLPLVFEPNQGQASEPIQYLVRHGQALTAFASDGVTTKVAGSQITMTLKDAAPQQFRGAEQLASTSNYFLGSDPSRWQTGVPNFRSLIAASVYPGIDLKYYGTNLPTGRQGAQLEHDFVVSPGADASQIAFSFTGQDSLSLDQAGNLVLTADNEELRLNAPITYQTDGASKHTVPSHFELHDDTVRIAVADSYDRTKPLVIDPTLVYATYLGGSGSDFGRKVVVDSSGNAYVTGETASTDFVTSAPYQGSFGGGSKDAFVTKLNASGTAVVYSTYLGGSSEDYALGITVDGSGNAYVTGDTSSTDFPVASAYQGSHAGGGNDVFITKLNSAGSGLVFSTYLGGTGDDKNRMVALDGSDNVYLTGYTASSDYPTAAAYQSTIGGFYDGYVTALNAAGTALIYSTYLGGIGSDTGYDLTVSSGGNAYVIGSTESTDFPVQSAYQAAYGGGTQDAILAKFDSSGTLNFSTFLGGTLDDYGRGIAIDGSEDIYLAGLTKSTNFPVQNAHQPVASGNYDAFVTKMDTNGTGLSYSTYLGGSGEDNGLGIGVTTGNEAYVTGYTDSTDLPTILPYQSALSGGSDILMAKFDTGGSMRYSTYLGGSGVDYALGLHVGPNSRPYITGYTDSTDLPTTGLYQTFAGGAGDAFVAQLSDDSFTVSGITDPMLQFTLGATVCDLGQFSTTLTKFCTHTLAAGTNAPNGYILSYVATPTLTNGAYTISAMATQTASVLGSEQFGFNLKANTAAGSFTSSNFGAEPSGGSGTVMSGYNVADQFKFNVAGDNIAESTTASLLTTFTAAFIANIQFATEAGTYATPITYNIVASY